jgi:Monoamine oxidase
MESGPLQPRLVLLRACRLQAELAPADRNAVENRVFFAGEATSQFFPATVHGAFLSGVRAAYEIMLADAKADLMKDSQGEVDTYV